MIATVMGATGDGSLDPRVAQIMARLEVIQREYARGQARASSMVSTSKRAADAREMRWRAVLDSWNPRWLSWQGVADFMTSELMVLTPERERVPFELRFIQRKIVAAEIRARRAKKRPAFIILKFRKVGATTLELALAYWDISRRPDQLCVSFGHTPTDTKTMFRAADLFWEAQNPAHRHVRSEAFVEQLELTDINGLMMARTPGGGGAGRGSTYSRIHVAEASRVSDLRELHSGLAKSRGEQTAYVLESTAAGTSGVGQPFYDFWKAAVAGKNDLIPIFIPWQMDPNNKIALLAPDEIDRTLKEDEEARELMEKHALTKEQMKWWLRERAGIVVDGASSQLIHQEMPTSADDAFLASIDGYYDRALLKVRDRLCEDGENVRVEENGRLRIWEDALPGARYVIGCDVSGGVGGALSVAVGINCVTGRQAFEWAHDRTAPDFFGSDVLPRLGKRWKSGNGTPALIVCENNNHGHSTLAALLRIAQYPRECVYHNTDETRVDDWNDTTPTKVAGWTHGTRQHADLTNTVGRIVYGGYPHVLSKRVIASVGEVGFSNEGADFKDRDYAVAVGLAAIGMPYMVEGSTKAYLGGRVVDLYNY